MQKKIIVLIFLVLIISTTPISFAQENNENIFKEFSFDNRTILIITNVALLFTTILFLKNKIPTYIINNVKKIFAFEISKRNATIVMAIIFSLYILSVVNEFDDTEDHIADSFPVRVGANNFDLENIESYSAPKYLLLHLSIKIFDNIKIIPFIASLSLLLAIYFLTTEIAKKRFAGILAVLIVLQSPLWLKYDTFATYENFWMLFYFLSIYLIIKHWHVSILSFIISFLSKALTFTFLPMSIFFILRSSITKKKKIYATIVYMSILILGIIAILNGKYVTTTEFSYSEFVTGFKQFSVFLDNDLLVVIGIIPLVVGLFVISRRGNHYADSIQMMFVVIFLSLPFLLSLTILNNHDYRMIPIVIVFAIGVGTLFSNNYPNHYKKSDNYISITVFLITISIIAINMLSVIFPDIIQGHYKLEFGSG